MSSGDEFDDHYETQRRRQTVKPTPSPPKQNVEWIDDGQASACYVCKESFSLVKRKHHCRSCGNVICSSCSVFVPVAKKKTQRVCLTCVEGIKKQKQTDPRGNPRPLKNKPPNTQERTSLSSAMSSYRLHESIDNWFMDEEEYGETTKKKGTNALPKPQASAIDTNSWAALSSSRSVAATKTTRFQDITFDDRPLYDEDPEDTSRLATFPTPSVQKQAYDTQVTRSMPRPSASLPRPSVSPPRSPASAYNKSEASSGSSVQQEKKSPVASPPPETTATTKPVEKRQGFRATLKKFFGRTVKKEGPPPEPEASTAIVVAAPPPTSPPSPEYVLSSRVSEGTNSSLKEEQSVSRRRWTIENSNAALSSMYENTAMLSNRHAPSDFRKESTQPRRDTFDEMFEGPRHVEPVRDINARGFDMPSLTKKAELPRNRRDTLDDIVFGDDKPNKSSANAPTSSYGAYTSFHSASRFGGDRFATAPTTSSSNYGADRFTTAPTTSTNSSSSWGRLKQLEPSISSFDPLAEDDKQEAEFDPVSGTYILPKTKPVVVHEIPQTSMAIVAQPTNVISENVGNAIVDKLSSLENEIVQLKNLLAQRKASVAKREDKREDSIFNDSSASEEEAPKPIVKKTKPKKAVRKDSFDDLFNDEKKAYDNLFDTTTHKESESESDTNQSKWPGRNNRRKLAKQTAPSPSSRYNIETTTAFPKATTSKKHKDSFQDLFEDSNSYKSNLFDQDASDVDSLNEASPAENPKKKEQEEEEDLPKLRTVKKAPSTITQVPKTSKPIKGADEIDDLFRRDSNSFEGLYDTKVNESKPILQTQPSNKQSMANIQFNYSDNDSEEELPSLRSYAKSTSKDFNTPEQVINDLPIARTESLTSAPLFEYELNDSEEELPSLRSKNTKSAPLGFVNPEEAIKDSPPSSLNKPAPATTLFDYEIGDDEVELPSLRSQPKSTVKDDAKSDPVVKDLMPLRAETKPTITIFNYEMGESDEELPSLLSRQNEPIEPVQDAKEDFSITSQPFIVPGSPKAQVPKEIIAEPTLDSEKSTGFIIDLDEEFDTGLFGAATVQIEPTNTSSPGILQPATQVPNESFFTSHEVYSSNDGVAKMPTTVEEHHLVTDSPEESFVELPSHAAPSTSDLLVEKEENAPQSTIFDDSSYVHVNLSPMISPVKVEATPAIIAESVKDTSAPFTDLFEPQIYFDVPNNPEEIAVDDASDNESNDELDFNFERKPRKPQAVAIPVPTPQRTPDVYEQESILLGSQTIPTVTESTENDNEETLDLAKVDNAEFDASWQVMQQDEKHRKQNVLKRQRQLQRQKQKERQKDSAEKASKKEEKASKKDDKATKKEKKSKKKSTK
ncbi:hypothetical protein THRCLA_04007 [Thraustotheca clavata]|uniref:FYVE-type domain-containing protein n=1 Tax=Thraustotheca clavata TaxID=74557 RepID=A0A1W0A059_9STRA|nr:hypothetical protein THRCLA_04007 [Thraustotheca clavata]